ncbi:MAG: hypothetical protein HY646_22435 [Acidobacteria bacterium]|nr:hypothetical protein [Acidobacteriota bacterium]
MHLPLWALPMLTTHLVAFFSESPVTEDSRSDGPPGFREQVEEEIRDVLLGLQSQLAQFGTDRAFLSMSGRIPADLQERLSAIPKRLSSPASSTATTRLPAERTLRFKADLPVGAVILGVPVPSAYYEAWYSMLLLDRLLLRVLPKKPNTMLRLSVRPYYYRLELPVPSGQLHEEVEESLLQELQRLQFARARPEDLEAARRNAVAYLESFEVKEWFATQGIAERRDEGLRRIQNFTADDMRTGVRDLLLSNRVIATWSPRPQRPTAQVESLGSVGAVYDRPNTGGHRPPLQAALTLPEFPVHTDREWVFTAPERLPSGIDMIPSTVYGVFVSGGTLTLFDREPDASILTKFQEYRPDRILVLTPPASVDRTRQLWTNFIGNPNDKVFTVPLGNIATGDLAALYFLKMLLDRRLIEAGLWRDVRLAIDANTGSTLTVKPENQQPLITSWIKDYAATAPSEAEIAWARETAIHHLPGALPHLQSITWQRDPLGIIQNLQTVTATHIQDVARIYFN